MSMNHKLPKKISLVPKKHHGFQFLIFLLGCLLPPIAVLVRFGVGSDLFINIFLCICGYFPCHIHNFYIQNIRNNQNRSRTPKWAIKYGLVDNSDRERKARKSQWAKRYDERNNESTLVGQPLEEGEEGDNYDPTRDEDPEAVARRRNEGLWTRGEEEYYNEDQAPNQRNWHYPANFEGTVGDGRSKRKTGRANGTGSDYGSGDRWERTRAARDDLGGQRNGREGSLGDVGATSYPPAASTDDDVPEWGRDYGSKSKKSGKKLLGGAGGKKAGKGGVNEWMESGRYVSDQPEYGSGNGNGYGTSNGGARSNGSARPVQASGGGRRGTGGDPNWDHEF